MHSLSRIITETEEDFFNPFVYGYPLRNFAIWYGRQVKHLRHIDQKIPLKAQLVNKVFSAIALLLLAPLAFTFPFYGLVAIAFNPLLGPSSRIKIANTVARRATETGRIGGDALFSLIHLIQEAHAKPETINPHDLSYINDIERRVNDLPGCNNGQGIVVEAPGDGDCLFWSFFYHSYLQGRENRVSTVEEERARAVRWEEAHYERIEQAITALCQERRWQNRNQYFREMRIPRRRWGDDPEIMALSQIHNLEVLVYDVSRNRYQSNYFQGTPQGRIVLEYVNRNHYNLIFQNH